MGFCEHSTSDYAVSATVTTDDGLETEYDGIVALESLGVTIDFGVTPVVVNFWTEDFSGTSTIDVTIKESLQEDASVFQKFFLKYEIIVDTPDIDELDADGTNCQVGQNTLT